MKTKRIFVITIALGLLLACSAQTKFRQTWRNPEAGPIHFQKVLAIAIMPDDTMRRVAEDEMVKNAKRAEVVPSYKVLPAKQARDLNLAKETIRRMGFDGAVVMRLVDVKEEQYYVPGTYTYAPYYVRFWTYYGWAWARPYHYTPGYLARDRNYRIETNIYSITDDRLVWSGVSDTMNPSSINQLVDSVAKATMNTLKKEGLLAVA